MLQHLLYRFATVKIQLAQTLTSMPPNVLTTDVAFSTDCRDVLKMGLVFSKAATVGDRLDML